MREPTYEHAGRHRALTFDTRSKPESRRVYTFPGGDKIVVEDVIECRVSRHGNHKLVTLDGTVHVVPWGWICVSYPLEANVTPES